MRIIGALGLALLVGVLGCSVATPANGDDDSSGDDSSGHPDARRDQPPDASQVIPPDAAVPIDANHCATQPCDIPTQCGCGANMACDIDTSDLMGTACRAAGTDVVGNTCAAFTDCAAGFVCVGDGTNDACEKYCTNNTDCAQPRGQCVEQLTDQNQQPIAGAVTCTSNCDPAAIANPLCPSGWSCDIFTATFNAATYDIADCRIIGAGTQGAACTSGDSCAAGYSCINNGTSDVCARICKPPSNSGCGSGTTCLEFNPVLDVGGTEYGVCL